jgi:hypothetical protein
MHPQYAPPVYTYAPPVCTPSMQPQYAPQYTPPVCTPNIHLCTLSIHVCTPSMHPQFTCMHPQYTSVHPQCTSILPQYEPPVYTYAPPVYTYTPPAYMYAPPVYTPSIYKLLHRGAYAMGFTDSVVDGVGLAADPPSLVSTLSRSHSLRCSSMTDAGLARATPLARPLDPSAFLRRSHLHAAVCDGHSSAE